MYGRIKNCSIRTQRERATVPGRFSGCAAESFARECGRQCLGLVDKYLPVFPEEGEHAT